MIGLDTNVLVRYVLDDDPVWSPVVTDYIDREITAERPAYINIVTLVELVWVLRRQPDFSKERIIQLIGYLLQSRNVVLGERGLVEKAVARYRDGGAGFADYVIAEMNLAAGASKTVTIDKKASRSEPFERLRPK
jgi:predicted nucleic-acid-binding protein